jgi:hypothetical protein
MDVMRPALHPEGCSQIMNGFQTSFRSFQVSIPVMIRLEGAGFRNAGVF